MAGGGVAAADLRDSQGRLAVAEELKEGGEGAGVGAGEGWGGGG